VFNEFFYQNKFIVEKHIKFIIETNTHKIYWVKKKKIQGYIYKKSILKKKFNLYKIKKNHKWIISIF
jgi:hypothetical protein